MISICLWDALNIVLAIYVPHSNLDIANSTGGLNRFASSVGITGSSGDCDGVQTEPSGAVDERDFPWVPRGARKWALITFPIRIQMKLVYLCDHGNPSNKIASGRRRANDDNLVSIDPTNDHSSSPSPRCRTKLNPPVELGRITCITFVFLR
ncbi:hypothetical protein PILCRDRAFT_628732 [Piloderma croceum F 1598]|uniref:Uncharacterized protein n=1 Tax=Piloderma croceum (strain F 1598) TaxID=765440 RepID=A0A0C3FBR9_PILCF|nr:hypothetical protein PILCRDRAFT_628732 [Piloderma croceum F 1598]